MSAGNAVANAALFLELGTLAPPAILGPPEGEKQITRLDPTGVSVEPLTAELMWLPVEGGEVRLVWSFQVHTEDREHAYDLTVDASSGEIWTQFDWVAGDSYTVYPAPAESPNHVSPTPPSDGRTVATNPANATASPYGWHDTNGATGAEYTIMRGNNVHAYDDIDNDNAPPNSEPDCGTDLTCDFLVDLTQAPSSYTSAAVANLFYWNNYIHDVQYQYGFTETAGNFQVNNYGKGGIGGDDVRAEALDGGGTNNANMMTPADGGRPRMQMYVWTGTNPDVTGDFDNGIIVHEYGHGISNRLVGGPSNASCLANYQQPGEGLSDWWTLAYTAKAGDAGTDGRGIGTYALGQAITGGGIRAQRYSTDSSINTWTYESINGATRPHGIGAVWAQAMWEVYWALVDAHGFSANLMDGTGTAGNQRAMLYVNEGLMNTSCSPAFTDVVAGIVQAATDNHGGADTCRVWDAFATFGLGTNAVSGGANSASPTNGYGRPLACLSDAPTMAINDVSVTEGDSGNVTAAFAVTLSASSSVPVAVDYATADSTAVSLTAASTVSNTAALDLPGTGTNGPASVYPSTITVPTTTTTLTDVNVTLTGFTHTWPADIDVLLVGPTGAQVYLMSDSGGGTNVSDLTLVFDDAGSAIPSALSSGTYIPTNASTGDSFPSPAPSGTRGTELAVFNGTDPTGTWSLYIVDDAAYDEGELTGGWSLTLGLPSDQSDYTATSGTLTFSGNTTSQSVNVTVVGDTRAESNETFAVNLSNTVNVTLSDAQGIGTIVTDDATRSTWTDDTLAAGSTTPKAVHITELRTRTNTVRAGCSLGAFSFSDSTLTVGVTAIQAVHITELRTALAEAYVACGVTAPTYTDATLSSAITIKAVHVTELRAAVVLLE